MKERRETNGLLTECREGDAERETRGHVSCVSFNNKIAQIEMNGNTAISGKKIAFLC